MSGVWKQSSCKQIFRILNILPVACIYINETICYDKLEQKVEVHNYKTHERQPNLHVHFWDTDLFNEKYSIYGS